MHTTSTSCCVPAAIAALQLLASAVSAQCAVLVDITPGTAADTNTDHITAAFGQELYFAQWTAAQGSELWKWSVATGALIVSDLAPGVGNSNPEQLTPCCTPIGPRLFFAAFEIGHGQELYVSDGTAAGTHVLKEIRPGSASSLPHKFTVCGERVFFQANDGVHGEELWVSDGTAAGTVMVRDINPGSGNGRPSDLVALRDKVLFSASDGTNGRELWISDGTTAGTLLLVDVWPGASSAEVGRLALVDDVVYFGATTAALGAELWRTDGTAAGTWLVADVLPGILGSDPFELCACGERLFFRTFSAAPGAWVSDGTAAGTTHLGGTAEELTCAGNRVFFRRSNVASGAELWTSDGTLAGTQLVVDLRPGALSSSPHRLTSGGPGVFFVADTTVAGELWFSDGTATGTLRVCTLDPTGSHAPDQLTMCRGALFFTAHSPSVGNELFLVATPGASTALLGTSGRPDHATLRVRDGAVPVLGTTVELVGEGPAGQIGILLFNAIVPPLPVPVVAGLIDGGSDWINLQLGQANILAAAIGPSLSMFLSVPNSAATEGQVFHLQTLWWSPSGSPALQLSNGIQLTLGTALPH